MTIEIKLGADLAAGTGSGGATAKGELIETATELQQGTATPLPCASEGSA